MASSINLREGFAYFVNFVRAKLFDVMEFQDLPVAVGDLNELIAVILC